MRRYLLGLSLLLVAAWASMPAPGYGGAPSLMPGHASDLEAATLGRVEAISKMGWSGGWAAKVTPSAVVHASPYRVWSWRRSRAATVTAADTVKVSPSFYGPGALAMDHPDLSVRDSVAAGAWSIKVWRVTNTDTAGAGSWHSARDSIVANATGVYNVVIFTTGGRIELTDSSSWGDISNAYIACQSAPGGGISFHTTGNSRPGINGEHDVVVRGCRFEDGSSGVKATNSWRIVWDHLSIRAHSFGGGQTNFGITADSTSSFADCDSTPCSRDLTLQNSLVYWPNDDGQRNALVDGIPGADALALLKGVLGYRTGFFGPGIRFPEFSGDSVVWANTLSANGIDRHVRNENPSRFDLIESYIQRGPASAGNTALVEWSENTNSPTGAMHLSALRTDATGFDRTVSDDSLWRGSKRTFQCKDRSTTPNECTSDGDTVPIKYKRDTPLTLALMPPVEAITDALKNEIADDAGASWRISADGQDTLRIRDAFDDSVTLHFEEDRGLASTVDRDTLSYPVPASGTACGDADSDGLCDAFEKLATGDPNDSTSILPSDDSDGDGNFAIEEANDPDLDPTVDDTPSGGGGGGGHTATICNAKPDSALNAYRVKGEKTISGAGVTYPDLPAASAVQPLRHPTNDTAAIALMADTVSALTAMTAQALQDTLASWGLPVMADTVSVRDKASVAGLAVCGGS